MYKRVLNIFRHISIILSLVFLTFIILDWYNPLMGFMTNTISTWLMGVFCIEVLISSLLQFVCLRKTGRHLATEKQS